VVIGHQFREPVRVVLVDGFENARAVSTGFITAKT
jgi:hypothetical protein